MPIPDPDARRRAMKNRALLAVLLAFAALIWAVTMIRMGTAG